jgi:hypothetical protein
MNKNLPTVQELRSGDLALKTDQTHFSVIVNAEPPKEWVRDHPFAKKVKYIPIERVEYLLTRIFINWNVEVKSVQVIANSVVVTIRLHYQDVFSEKMLWQDGIGAAPIQTDSGAGAMDWNHAKADGVMKAAPAAESYAVKDAAEKIGKLFGKDLNRADKIMYDSLAPKEDRHAEIFEEVETDNN